MVYSGLWLEQLDPMERMQSNMWCWRKTALSLGNQPSSSIWGSTLQRGQDWDWYMQHWTVLWSVHDWHPPLSFRLLWHLVLLVVLWSCWKSWHSCGLSEGTREPWTPWSECSVTCGGGYRSRTRGPVRVHGTAQQFSACNLQPCGTTHAYTSIFCTCLSVFGVQGGNNRNISW